MIICMFKKWLVFYKQMCFGGKKASGSETQWHWQKQTLHASLKHEHFPLFTCSFVSLLWRLFWGWLQMVHWWCFHESPRDGWSRKTLRAVLFRCVIQIKSWGHWRTTSWCICEQGEENMMQLLEKVRLPSLNYIWLIICRCRILWINIL